MCGVTSSTTKSEMLVWVFVYIHGLLFPNGSNKHVPIVTQHSTWKAAWLSNESYPLECFPTRVINRAVASHYPNKKDLMFITTPIILWIQFYGCCFVRVPQLFCEVHWEAVITACIISIMPIRARHGLTSSLGTGTRAAAGIAFMNIVAPAISSNCKRIPNFGRLRIVHTGWQEFNFTSGFVEFTNNSAPHPLALIRTRRERSSPKASTCYRSVRQEDMPTLMQSL